MRRSRRPFIAAVATLIAIAIATSTWAAPSVSATVASYTALTIDGEAGAWVGGGVPQAYTDADSTFATSDSFNATTPGYILLIITGTTGPTEGHWYYVHLAAPPGQDLHVGTYTGATRAAFRKAGEPGIDIYGDAQGCNEVAGEFTVNEIDFAGSALVAFSASYSFRCDSLPAEVAGEVRYGSAQSFAGLRQLPADPTALNFGSSNIVGISSDPRTTGLVNVGSSTIGLSAFGIAGDHPDDYAQSAGTCGSSLAPGASCSWDTTFTPTASGPRSAQATYTTDTHGFAHGQALSGWAVPASRLLQIVPSDGRAFGDVVVGTVSSQAFSISSVGTVPVSIGTRSIVGADAADFAVAADDCPAELAPAATCTVTVEFAPAVEGPKSAVLSVQANAEMAPFALPLTGTAVRPTSGVTWGTVRKPGPKYTWTYGGTLGRTVQSGSQRLHLAYATNRINGTWARDAGPYAGIYYIRSTSGATWTTPKRINPAKQHAIRPALAATGARVYVAWVTQTKLYNYSPTAPRVLYVRVNTNHGGAAAWKSVIRLSSATGRVDYPTIAASGQRVAIAWTDSVTGAIRLAISQDRGATWKVITIGSTSVAGPSGRIGLPSVAIDGTRIVVSWVADMNGTVQLRTSVNAGASWAAVQTVGSESNGYTSTAIRGSRIAIAWTTPSAVVARVNQSGTWGSPFVVATMPTSPSGAFPYGPDVVLQDPNRVAVSWSEQLPEEEPHVYLRWSESADNGAHWFRNQTIATHVTSGTVVNDAPSVLWPSASTRIVEWNGWTPWTTNYRLFLRIGVGAPTAPLAARVWSPIQAAGTATIAPIISSELGDRLASDPRVVRATRPG